MLSAWKSRASFEPGSNLKAWLFVIQRNAYYSAHRRNWCLVRCVRGEPKSEKADAPGPEAA
jgi:DNA-directed RNA polymerase specialized sigma24 family protein